MTGIKYSDRQIRKLLEDIHSGIITDMNLPQDLYEAIGKYMESAVYKGFGNTLKNVSTANAELLSDLRDNTWLFSAAKTYTFTNAAMDRLRDEDGVLKPFNKFYDDGVKVYGQYCKDYAEAEQITTVATAQTAKQWQSIQANKEIIPYLIFSTDGSPCPECAPFEGLKAPVDSPVWDTCLAPLHFRCLCIIVPDDDPEGLTSQADIDVLPIDDNIPEDFQNNPGKTGEIFPASHPYFEDTPEDVFKQLQIPDADSE